MTFPDLARVTALTFDCYGTLIDWEAGAIEALRPLLARHRVTLSDDEIIQAFQDIDAELCAPPYRPYRAVLAGVVEGLGRRFGFQVGSDHASRSRSATPTGKPKRRPKPSTTPASTAL